jgi:pimeloyl-ACP methyl ester carboxylesterase
VQWVEPLGPLFAVGRRPLGRVAWGVVQCMVPVRHLALDAWIRISPPGDQLVFKRPEMREMFIDDLVRAAHRNVQSLINDVVLFSRYWGFSLRDLRVPIRFWHGDADWIVPLAHAERMAELVPDSELRIRHGESHIGALDAAEEIFDTLLELWPGAHTASA